jgi:molybdopterin molybdotransferase
MSFLNNSPGSMLEYEQACERLLARIPAAAGEVVAVAEGLERYLLEAATAQVSLPAFDNSAMDGYAVRSSDIAAAGKSTPISLRIIGRIAAGECFTGSVGTGECIRLFTGSPVPSGADSVIMQEDTRQSGGASVVVFDKTRPGENVRPAGSDVKQGATLLSPGDQLTPAAIALLGAAGVARVSVARRPRIVVLATGSELREPGQNLGPGQIYESNRAAVAGLARQAGGVCSVFPLVRDTLAETRAALEHAFSEHDAVITSGGVSVGEMDFVKSAFQEMGGQLEFWRVAIKPGRPFLFGTFGSKFLFGLPGNPVSAFVTFLLLVRPALLRWQGARLVTLPSHLARMGESISNPGERRHFMRVHVDEAGVVRSAGLQASHALSSLALANGLVDVRPGKTFLAGEQVAVMRFA